MNPRLSLELPLVPRTGEYAYLGYALPRIIVSTEGNAVLITVRDESLDEDEQCVGQVTLEVQEGELRMAVDTNESLLEHADPPETVVLYHPNNPFPFPPQEPA